MVKESGLYAKWIENEVKLLGKYYQQFYQTEQEEKFNYNQIILAKMFDEFILYLHGIFLSLMLFILEFYLFFLAKSFRMTELI